VKDATLFLMTGKDITEKQGATPAEEKRENKHIQNFSEKNMSKIIMTIDVRPLAREIERSVRRTTCRPSFAMRVKKKFARKAKFFSGWSDQ
jgi:hypothetical protein